MTQKLSITVPDDLSSRLEKVRDKFNISRVCQEAIAREVAIQELATNLANDDSVFERLKLQKAKNELTSEQLGKQDGTTIARGMSYMLLDRMCHFLTVDLDLRQSYVEEEGTLSKTELQEMIINRIRELPESERIIIGLDMPFDEFLAEKYDTSSLEFIPYVGGLLEALDGFHSACIKKGLYEKK